MTLARDLTDTELVAQLVENIGPTLTAFVANTSDRNHVSDWIRMRRPVLETARIRLELAYDLLNDVAEAKGNDYARAWFIGAHTGADEISPVEAIRDRQFDDARVSAGRAADPEEMGD